EFIRQFPNSPRALDAQNRIRLLEEMARERQLNAAEEKAREDAARALQETCQRESSELAAMRDDLPGLQTARRRWKCPDVIAAVDGRIDAIIEQREQATRAEEQRLAAERQRLAERLCNNARETGEQI